MCELLILRCAGRWGGNLRHPSTKIPEHASRPLKKLDSHYTHTYIRRNKWVIYTYMCVDYIYIICYIYIYYGIGLEVYITSARCDKT